MLAVCVTSPEWRQPCWLLGAFAFALWVRLEVLGAFWVSVVACVARFGAVVLVLFCFLKVLSILVALLAGLVCLSESVLSVAVPAGCLLFNVFCVTLLAVCCCAGLRQFGVSIVFRSFGSF